MLSNGFELTNLYIVFIMLCAIYSFSINRSFQNNDKEIKKNLKLMGFKINSKVTENAILFLYTIASPVFKELGLSSLAARSKQYCTISWLTYKKEEKFSFMIFNISSGNHEGSQFDSVIVITFYDIEKDRSEINKLIETIDLPEYTELIDDGKYISLLIENNSITQNSLTSILHSMGYKLNNKKHNISSVTKSEHVRSKIKDVLNKVWVTRSFLFILCLYWGNITLYSVTTLSLNLPDDGYPIPIFWEESPLVFTVVSLVQLFFLYILSKHFLSSFIEEDEHQKSKFTFIYSLIIACSFLSLNYFSGIQLENRYAMESYRFEKAAERSLKQNSNIPTVEFKAKKIPLVSLSLIELTKNAEFKKLESMLSDYHDQLDNDIANDMFLYKAYLSFAIEDEKLLRHIMLWKKSQPVNPQPLLAEAFYYFGKAWRVRGTKRISLTPEKNIREMKVLLLHSKKLLEEAFFEQSYKLLSSALLIDVIRPIGDNSSLEKVYENALLQFKASYLLRYRFLISLQPRWGGSYRATQNVIDEAQNYSDTNKQLILLKGYLFEEAGDILAIDGFHKDAGDFYTFGLKFGKNPTLLWKKGKSEYRQKNYSSALSYFNQAIELNSNAHDYYSWRSSTFYRLNKFAESKKDLLLANSLQPNKESYNKRIQDLTDKLTKMKGRANYREHYGFSLDGKALDTKLIPNNKDLNRQDVILYMGALNSIKNNDVESAAIKLIEAIEVNPRQIKYYLTLDMVLGQSKQWTVIINYWKKFIDLYPNNGRAHFEISGTYYHNKDSEKSLYHMKKASDLGYPEAETTYKRLMRQR
ncbi:tetratricopeptide repeat protein [Thalassotalea sp. PLHSN55]|uniref:tetratricopeptide repeat protein n=1 Tax=Thalassotalea sp. PLHSN55 TaxID=3435888 RepID=UPI003F835167